MVNRGVTDAKRVLAASGFLLPALLGCERAAPVNVQEDKPERRPGEDQVVVTLTRGYWTGKYEVTQGQWKQAMGKCGRKSAEAIARHVEALLSAKIGGQPVPRDTAVWLAEIGAVLRDELAAVGLVEPQQRLTVGAFFTGWLADKTAAGFGANGREREVPLR